MLPNLKFLACGVLFCLVLFVAAGTITLPESAVHVGEMPDIARPMMQESIAVPPPVPVIAMMVSHDDEAGGDGGTGVTPSERTPGDANGRESSPPAPFPGAEPAAAGLSGTRSPGPETSGAAVRSQGAADDPLRVLIDGLSRAGQERERDVADAAPDPGAGAAALPVVRHPAARLRGARAPRRAAHGRRHLPGVAHHRGVSPMPTPPAGAADGTLVMP